MTHRTGMDFGFQRFSRDRFRPEEIIGATLILGTLPFLFDLGFLSGTRILLMGTSAVVCGTCLKGKEERKHTSLVGTGPS